MNTTLSFPASLVPGAFVAGHSVVSRYKRVTQIDYQQRYLISPRTLVPHDYRADDLFHVWADGDWLDLLAFRYYGDPVLWWVIADFNQITDPRIVEVGRVLRLPTQRRVMLEILTLTV